MDGYGYQGGFNAEEAATAQAENVAAAIGADERRMHVRAYNYWVSLLDGRDYPSIEDLDPANVEDFAPHSVLLDFTAGRDNPATPYIGTALRNECGLTTDVQTIDEVPSRSLLSRLTDHYLQIIANRAPIGFEAEFVNQAERNISYRGILMPFSSDGDTIDFIYGVINWKTSGEASAPATIIPALTSVTLGIDPFPAPVADAPAHADIYDDDLAEDELLLTEADEDAGLADRLSAARDSAEVCKQQDGRSRAALYRALAMAYDFAVAARRATDDYAEILEDAGVKAQARAPMTPIVKLVFGIDYDKTRLTEFAAALSFAARSGVEFGEFMAFIEGQSGGLKGLVSSERQARRPAAQPPINAEIRRTMLRARPALSLSDLPTNEEFALVLTRRNADGVHEVVALVRDEALLEKAVRKAA